MFVVLGYRQQEGGRPVTAAQGEEEKDQSDITKTALSPRQTSDDSLPRCNLSVHGPHHLQPVGDDKMVNSAMFEIASRPNTAMTCTM